MTWPSLRFKRPASPSIVLRPQDQWLFTPQSMIWRVNQESVVVLGGMTALLLQFAHPLVAAGVRDHSDFRSDPTGRLLRTYRLTLNLVFGTREQALESAREINRRHRTVQGPDYSATDPDLLLWVQATLIYSPLGAYSEFRLARGMLRALDGMAPPLLRELRPARLAGRRVESLQLS